MGRPKGSRNKKKTWQQILDRTNRKLVVRGAIDVSLLDEIMADPEASYQTRMKAWAYKIELLGYSIAKQKPIEAPKEEETHVQLGLDFGD